MYAGRRRALRGSGIVARAGLGVHPIDRCGTPAVGGWEHAKSLAPHASPRVLVGGPRFPETRALQPGLLRQLPRDGSSRCMRGTRCRELTSPGQDGLWAGTVG